MQAFFQHIRELLGKQELDERVASRQLSALPDSQEHSMQNFREIYGNTTLNKVFANETPVAINHPSLTWLHAPSNAFLTYMTQRAILHFEGVPPDPNAHKKEASYPLTQMHRLWVTTETIMRHLPLAPQGVVLDLGAFPFPIELILRGFVRYPGRIIASANIRLNEETQADLAKQTIETTYVNLDPYVQAGGGGEGLDVEGIPSTLSYADSSVDFVVFAHVIEHLYHPMTILKECFRVLKPGGKILISTDNAFMLTTLLHMLTLNDYLQEPIEMGAAMNFHFWRGHNRFFSGPDLERMMKSLGFGIAETAYYEVFYNAFSEEYFHHPYPTIPAWRAHILAAIPAYRNEVIVVAEKK